MYVSRNPCACVYWKKRRVSVERCDGNKVVVFSFNIEEIKIEKELV